MTDKKKERGSSVQALMNKTAGVSQGQKAQSQKLNKQARKEKRAIEQGSLNQRLHSLDCSQAFDRFHDVLSSRFLQQAISIYEVYINLIRLGENMLNEKEYPRRLVILEDKNPFLFRVLRPGEVSIESERPLFFTFKELQDSIFYAANHSIFSGTPLFQENEAQVIREVVNNRSCLKYSVRLAKVTKSDGINYAVELEIGGLLLTGLWFNWFENEKFEDELEQCQKEVTTAFITAAAVIGKRVTPSHMEGI